MGEDRRNDDDELRRRREDQEKKQKMLLLLLGFACLIQLFVSLQNSRQLATRWTRARAEETRQFEQKLRDSGGGTAGQSSGP